MIKKNSLLFNELIIMAVTRENDFPRAVGEWRNSYE
jgi:hypothetical protein